MKHYSLIFFLEIFLALFCFAFPIVPQELNQVSVVPESSQGAMREIAAKILQKAQKSGCDSSKCVLLVTDFYTSSEATSLVGVRLSDELATLLPKVFSNGLVVDRSRLRQYMSHTRIPLSYVKSDDGQRWIGRELGATTVLWAEIVLAHGKNEAKFNVVNARPHKGGGTFKTNLPTLLYKPEELQPVEPYPVLDKIESSKQGEILSKVDKPNIQPSCLYMPNPPPTEEARSRRLSGSILVDAVVLPEGKVKVLRIVRGMPFNLNEQTYKTLETWKCQPVVKNGQAVLTPVQFEVNFRFY